MYVLVSTRVQVQLPNDFFNFYLLWLDYFHKTKTHAINLQNFTFIISKKQYIMTNYANELHFMRVFQGTLGNKGTRCVFQWEYGNGEKTQGEKGNM